MTAKLMQCPGCPTKLQPLQASSLHAQRAWDAAQAANLPIPEHGPAALGWLALISHAQLCHERVPLRAFMEAYLRS